MSLTWLTDRLVLCPTREPIESEYLTPEKIETPLGFVEAWSCDSAEEMASDDYHAVAIKFPGAGGRAERSSPHPFELWEGANVRVFTINNQGYGNSSGKASLQNFAETCESVWKHISERFDPNRVIVIGNSLGCLSALYLAARYPVSGLYLRNPVPLAQMIEMRPRYNWWNRGGAKWIAQQVPPELNAVENARSSTCPVLFVQSEKDRVVPVEYQQLVVNDYSGLKKVFAIRGADHHHKISTSQEEEYVQAVHWLRDRAGDVH